MRAAFMYWKPSMRVGTKDKNVISWSDQISWGFILSMGVGNSIWEKSWGPLRFWLILGVLLYLPAVGHRLRRSASPALKKAGAAVYGLLVALIVLALLGGAERIYLTTGDSYPAWLAKRDVGQVDSSTYGAIVQAGECRRYFPIEVFEKKDGMVVYRCGFDWFRGATFIGHRKAGAE